MVDVFNIGLSVKKVIDKEFDIISSLQSIANKDVLVGVPEEDSPRKKGEVTNAELAFIHSNGSPLNNIPARPFIEPAIEQNKDILSTEMGQAITSSLEGNNTQAERHLKKAGMIGQNSARAEFTANNWTPLKPSTIRARMSKLSKGTKKKYKTLLESGQNVFTPLIDSGQLRKSVTYAIRDKNQ